jgi:hypothetical protein
MNAKDGRRPEAVGRVERPERTAGLAGCGRRPVRCQRRAGTSTRAEGGRLGWRGTEQIVDIVGHRPSAAALLEPGVAGAVDLQQQPGAWHPLAAAAVARGPTTAHRAQADLAQHQAQAALGDHDPLALGQQLGEVRAIDPA